MFFLSKVMTGSASKNGMHLSSRRAWYIGCVTKSPIHLAMMIAAMIGSKNCTSFVISIWKPDKRRVTEVV